MDIGRIEALALRPSLAAPPVRVDGARAIAFQGLDGDVYADTLSPRQLLLAGTDAYDAFALPPHAEIARQTPPGRFGKSPKGADRRLS